MQITSLRNTEKLFRFVIRNQPNASHIFFVFLFHVVVATIEHFRGECLIMLYTGFGKLIMMGSVY